MPNRTRVRTEANDKLDAPPLPRFYIVSPNQPQAHLLKSCLDSALTVASSCHDHLPLQAVIDNTTHGQCLYLLDCLKTDAATLEKQLDIGLSAVPDRIRIALYNIDQDANLAPLVKRFKIRGIFYRDSSQSIFIKGVNAILSGNLWLTRKMLADCILIAKDTLDEPSARALALLTPREIEILQHVVFGESNQEIADAMQVSLHTVKTHLYNIYKKINVPNRLQGALWAATHLREHAQG